MAFPVVQSVTETSFASLATSHSVNMPAIVGSGDLLMIFCGFFANTTPPSAPTGWSSLVSEKHSLVSHTASVFVREADGTEGGGTVSVSTDSARGAAQVYRITGWEGTLATAVEISSKVESFNSTPDPPSFNPTNWDVEDTLWIALAVVSDDDATVSVFPTGYSGGVDTITGAGTNSSCSIGSAYRENAASSEDPGSFTLSQTEQTMAYTIAIRPGSGGGGLVGNLLGGALIGSDPTGRGLIL